MRGASALKMDFNTTWRPDYLKIKRILEYVLIGYENMIIRNINISLLVYSKLNYQGQYVYFDCNQKLNIFPS